MREPAADDTRRRRGLLNRCRTRLLLDANRWAVAGGLAAGVFAAFMAWGLLRPAALSAAVSDNAIEMLFAGLVRAIITGTTLVVSINQLVLSQKVGSLGALRSRMDRAMDFRRSTDDLIGATTPADPADYLAALVGVTERRAVALQEVVSGGDGGDLGRAVESYVDDLLSNADRVRGRLDAAEFGTFAVVSAAIDYDYSRKIHALRRLRREHAADLGEAERAAFAELLEALAVYAPTREYIKALYIQWALVKLSRAILYSAVVGLTVSGGMVLFGDAATAPGTFLGVDRTLWIVSGAFTVSVLPFLVFTSYILRLATLAKRTLAMDPLDLQ